MSVHLLCWGYCMSTYDFVKFQINVKKVDVIHDIFHGYISSHLVVTSYRSLLHHGIFRKHHKNTATKNQRYYVGDYTVNTKLIDIEKRQR